MLIRLIAFFLFFLPFQFALNPTSDIDLPVGRVLAPVIICWWLAEGLSKRSLRVPSPLITGLIVSFLLWAGASLLWAENFEYALRKFLFLVNFLPLVFVFSDLARREEARSLWLRALLFGGVASALLALLVFLSQFIFPVGTIHTWLTTAILPFFLGGNLGTMVQEYSSLLVNIGGETVLRATGVFPDPHVASFYFGMVGILALGAFLNTRKLIYLFFAIILFSVDLLTFSRGGYIGLGAGAMVFVILTWSRLSHKWQSVSLLIFLTGMALLFTLGQPVLSRFTSSFSLEDTSNAGRITLWNEAIRSISEHPVFGTGIGNYAQTVQPTISYRTPYYAHNLYLDIGVELGLVGLSFFLAMVGSALYGCFKKWARAAGGMLPIAIISVLVLYLTHSMFETAFYSVHVFPLLVLFLALAWYDGDAYAESY